MAKLNWNDKRAILIRDSICRAYAARGVYRRMVVVPTAVTGRVCCYRDATKPLLQSDMDKLWSVKVEDNILKGTKQVRGHITLFWLCCMFITAFIQVFVLLGMMFCHQSTHCSVLEFGTLQQCWNRDGIVDDFIKIPVIITPQMGWLWKNVAKDCCHSYCLLPSTFLFYSLIILWFHSEGPNKAAIVEMTLPTSSYISVALRELLKRDTSWQVRCICSLLRLFHCCHVLILIYSRRQSYLLTLCVEWIHTWRFVREYKTRFVKTSLGLFCNHLAFGFSSVSES